jgi:hypothetical protein
MAAEDADDEEEELLIIVVVGREMHGASLLVRRVEE